MWRSPTANFEFWREPIANLTPQSQSLSEKNNPMTQFFPVNSCYLNHKFDTNWTYLQLCPVLKFFLNIRSSFFFDFWCITWYEDSKRLVGFLKSFFLPLRSLCVIIRNLRKVGGFLEKLFAMGDLSMLADGRSLLGYIRVL